LSGSNLNAVTRKNGVDTRVSASAWNTSTTVPTLTNGTTYELYWTNSKVYFCISDVLMHLASFVSDTWTNTVSLPIRFENNNDNGANTNQTISSRVASIHILGDIHTNTQYGRITGASTQTLKFGAGTLHRVAINTPPGSTDTITVYDNVGGTTLPIAVIKLPNGATCAVMEYGIPFGTGLTVVATGTCDATIIYE
jgi:hypothetical protein